MTMPNFRGGKKL